MWDSKNCVSVLVKGSITQHSGGGKQLVATGLLPAVLQGASALVRDAPQHDVFAFLCRAFGVAPGLGWLHCGEKNKQRTVSERGEK